MAVEAATDFEYEVPEAIPRGSSAGTRGPFTGIAVCETGGWASLCPELDIASQGESADDALSMLQEGVGEILGLSERDNLPLGPPTPERDLLEFLRGHDSPEPIVGRVFLV